MPNKKKLDIEELRTIIYLLFNGYKVDSVKALGRAALAKYESWKKKHQCTIDEWLDDVFLDLLEIEFIANQDYNVRAILDENDESLLDHINVTDCLNALFSQESKCSTKEQVNAFIDTIRSAYAKMGVNQNLTKNLFAKFFS